MYDLLVELGHAIAKHGLSLSALGTAIFVLLKQRAVKRRLRKLIPWLFADDDETREYVENQRRIEAKIDLLLNERGIVCPAEWTVSKSLATKPKGLYDSLGRYFARSVPEKVGYGHIIISRRITKMKSKFASRKFWMSVISAALVIANDGLDLGLDTNTVLAFAGIIMSFVFGEAYVDAKKVSNGESKPYFSDHGPAV